MSVINTNVKSLVAQNSMTINGRNLTTAMERLSTGSRINSAADDAAGLAISTRMTSQVRGITMAIKNANDGINLLQTAEGAMVEVTNMLQRMRELAVQASSDTMTAADRASSDAEVQQLKKEIDRIASTTEFNSMKLLNGDFQNKTLQIGDKANQTLQVGIASVETTSLGLGFSATGNDALVSGRINIAGAVAAGDIKINGQEVGAIGASDDIGDVIKAINDNVQGVTASGFNVVVAKNVGDGITADGDLVITVAEIGQPVADATVFNISASNSLEELVNNINAQAGGVVNASINDDGKLVLANNTGATITIADGSGSAGNHDGGSGFATASTGYKGFLKLESTNGYPITVTKGTGDETDMEALGFREVEGVTDGDKYTVTGKELTSAGVTGAWARGEVFINGQEIWDVDIATTTFGGKLDAINNFTDKTGVIASAYFDHTFDTSAVWTDGSFSATDEVVVNGQTIAYGADVAAFVTNFNAKKDLTGLTATANGNLVTVSGSGVQALTTTYDDGAGGGAAAGADIFGAAGSTYGRIRLDSVNNTPISINLGEGAAVAEHGLLEMNVGAADFDVNATTLGAASGSVVSGLGIQTAAEATKAIGTLDKALDQVAASRSQLGALQNRLTHTVDNLTNVSTNIQESRSRILDTDYAVETTNLARAQIIQQAATAMLAQANQQPQTVLALLQ